MSHTINIIKDNHPQYLGNIKITKRGKASQIGFSCNVATSKIFFDPAVIDGVRTDKIWGDIVKKYVITKHHDVNNKFIFDEEDIAGFKIAKSRFFTYVGTPWADTLYVEIVDTTYVYFYDKQSKRTDESDSCVNLEYALKQVEYKSWKEIDNPFSANE